MNDSLFNNATFIKTFLQLLWTHSTCFQMKPDVKKPQNTARKIIVVINEAKAIMNDLFDSFMP